MKTSRNGTHKYSTHKKVEKILFWIMKLVIYFLCLLPAPGLGNICDSDMSTGTMIDFQFN